jgi:hypothetical protein
MIKTAHINLLESSAVTLSAGTEDTSCPLYRLYDRNIGRMFMPAAAEALEIKVDQGASGSQAVDRLLIPAGHNLDGMTLDVMHSENDVAYSPAVTQWVPSGSGLINKSWNAVTKRYWKFIITSSGSIPEIAELFLTSTYEWQRNPSRPTGAIEMVMNAENKVTAAGQDRFLVHGDPKRQRVYTVPRCGETQKDAVTALYDSWGGSAPFWLSDHEGNWICGKLTEVAYQSYAFNFNFLEVLP